jgi:large subunit ribosomal protein L4e
MMMAKKATKKKKMKKEDEEEKPKVQKEAKEEKEEVVVKKRRRKGKRKKKKATKKKKAPKGKVYVYDINGEHKRTVDIPKVFDTPFRPDLIRRDVTVSRANRRQVYGPKRRAGMRHSVEWWGKGRGVSRVPRLKDSRTAKQAPGTVGGRRAFPPQLDKDYSKKINKKERALARRSAIAALKDIELVKARGHRFQKDLELPVVIEDRFEEIDSTKEVIDILSSLGLFEDVERARKGTHIRAGRGKMRGRRKRRPKAMLVVVKEKKGIERGTGNLPGIDVVTVDQLNTEVMAPGGEPGRLTIFSEGAFKALGEIAR